jgi:hypothetical protein
MRQERQTSQTREKAKRERETKRETATLNYASRASNCTVFQTLFAPEAGKNEGVGERKRKEGGKVLG